MKCVAVGDVFITPEMMRSGFEGFNSCFELSGCFYSGSNDRKDMRNTVKIIEAGRGAECPLPDGLTEAVADAEALMVHLCPVTEKLLSGAQKLKYILCNRGGMENIDMEAAAKRAYGSLRTLPIMPTLWLSSRLARFFVRPGTLLAPTVP